MSKQKLITKESIDEEKNKKAIEDKIKELKKELRSRTYNHIGNLYKILAGIVRLRQYSDKNYRPRSLEWEKDIKLSAMQIRYIFSYQYISSYAEEKVKEGLISDEAICHFLAVSSLLRESQWQNILVDKIIEGNIKVSEVSELTKKELKLFLLGKLDIRKDDKYLLAATKTLRSILKRLEDRKEILKESPYKENLINSIVRLEDFIREVRKDGKNR